MTQLTPNRYDYVDASPVKSFFVSMLTRDIKLEEAILDLLDNCVDGILRSAGGTSAESYDGFGAEITFDSSSFSITDNCGGIPWDLHDYAFRMGRSPDRPEDAPGLVGVYGIGMKRAIFKIGKKCLISTRHGADQYEVEITPNWLVDETQWRIPVRESDRTSNDDGTEIVIGDLNEGIDKTFGESAASFKSELTRLIATHYAYIIDKGFRVTINGDVVSPRTTSLAFNMSEQSNDGILPFIFRGSLDEVEVYMAVGLTRPIPTQAELLDEQESKRYSSVDAGWTILCNGRAVLYCDRSELTGWGEAGVPRYHTQFIAISGIVDLRSSDPSKLPTTTTKRGIDASSPLYLQIKNKMREGMKIFTSYTNRWKGREDESRRHVEGVSQLSLTQLKEVTVNMSLSATKALSESKQFKPTLPVPQALAPTRRRISFVKEVVAIERVADYLGEPFLEPSEVGERSFDLVLEEAQR